MIAPLLATASLLLLPFLSGADPSAPTAVAPTHEAGGKPRKALQAWLKMYRKGRIEIYSSHVLRKVPLVVDWRPPEIKPKESFAAKYGLIQVGGLSNPTWLGDLRVIAEAVSAENSAAAAESLLELAAVGLDDRTYTREQAPDIVRGEGERWLGKLTDAEARALIAKVAAGGVRLSKSLAMPMQSAALRCLGNFGDPKYRSVIEPMLAHTEPVVRFHAAEALARLGDEMAGSALVRALEHESSEIALPAIADALRTLYSEYLPKLSAKKVKGAKNPSTRMPQSVRLAARAARDALGRSTWRADMALLRFLDSFRTKETIPALIDLLARFVEHPEEVQSGKLSMLVQHRAHELLISMTGGMFSATEIDKWRDLWSRSSEEISVQERHEPMDQANTVASGFAGIPVQGSRVLFILDLSGSMTFPMTQGSDTTTAGGASRPTGATRIDYARRELLTAIDNLRENQSFNLITFNGDTKAVSWSKDMVRATPRNLEKVHKYVDRMEPDGGTNLWSSLELALKTKSLVYGERYATNVDEIFILSDGAPTVGEVLDPTEILRLVREANRFAKMRINTVFISSDDPQDRRQRLEWMTIEPEELMRRLAEENGGKCVILEN